MSGPPKNELVSALEESFKLLVEYRFLGCAYEFVYQFATFKEEDGGDVANTKLYGYVVVFFDIAFAYYDFTIIFFS